MQAARASPKRLPQRSGTKHDHHTRYRTGLHAPGGDHPALREKITARDVATAHLAMATIEHLRELLADHNQHTSNALHSSFHRGFQLDATRALLAEIREIIE